MNEIVMKYLVKIKERSSEKKGEIFPDSKSWGCFYCDTNRKCLY